MRRKLGILLTALALVVAGCGVQDEDEGGGTAEGEYRIVHLLGLNQPGAGALNAQAASQAAKAAVEVLNERGGILGNKVVYELIETGGDPTTAVTKLNERLASGPTPNLILPGNTSAEALPMAPVITQAKVLSVQQAGAADLNNPTEFPYLFQVVPTNASMAAQLVKYLQENGLHRVAMISGKDAFGQATAEATRQALADAGIELVGDETYAAEDLDMTAQLERLRAADPDVLFLQGAGSPVGYVLESREKLGWMDVPVIADSTASVTSLLARREPDGLIGTPTVENVHVQVLTAAIIGSEEVNPGALDIMLDALAKQGEISMPLNTYFVYDAIMLAAAAAEKAGTISDAEQIAKTLETFTGEEEGLWALSRYSYSPDSHAVATDPTSTTIIPITELVNGRYDLES